MKVSALRWLSAASVLWALSGAAQAANPPGVTIDGSAAIDGWADTGAGGSFLYPGTVVSVVGQATTVQSGSSHDLGQIVAYLSGLQNGNTYTISFAALGTGFLDVLGPNSSTDFRNLTGNESNTTYVPTYVDAFGNTQFYRTGLDTAAEVFRVDTTQAQQFSLSFVANAPTANLFFKSEKLEGGLTIGVLSAVPEPETYAMMLAGLGALGFMARRRKTS